jgi:hypothetical protein
MWRAVQAALPSTLSTAQITLNVVQTRIGDLAAGVVRDARLGEPPSIPVALPSSAPTLTKKRVAGCVYIASEADAAVVQPLAAIFPGLNVWSTTPLPLGIGRVSGKPVAAKAVPRESESYATHLAASTLALDVAGCDERLPALAAEYGVPCIGVASIPDQVELWTELSMNSTDLPSATSLARNVLTDQCEAARLCAVAVARLEAIHQRSRKEA